jgi:hypothetical protein
MVVKKGMFRKIKKFEKKFSAAIIRMMAYVLQCASAKSGLIW